jgi:hypothetical protein
MTNFLYVKGRKKWRGHGGKHSTDAGHSGDRGCPGICRLTLGTTWIEGGDRRYGGRAMDADISVYRSVHEGGFGAQERQTLSHVC